MAHAPSQPRLLVVAGLVWLDGARVLVQRRGPGAGFGAGMLELPGGKVEPGEAPGGALARELVEEWGPEAATLGIGQIAEVLHHVYPAGLEVVLLVYHVDASAWASGTWCDRIRTEGEATVREYPVAGLPVSDFLPADRAFIAAVARGEVVPRSRRGAWR